MATQHSPLLSSFPLFRNSYAAHAPCTVSMRCIRKRYQRRRRRRRAWRRSVLRYATHPVRDTDVDGHAPDAGGSTKTQQVPASTTSSSVLLDPGNGVQDLSSYESEAYTLATIIALDLVIAGLVSDSATTPTTTGDPYR